MTKLWPKEHTLYFRDDIPQALVDSCFPLSDRLGTIDRVRLKEASKMLLEIDEIPT
jgi:hypothetical protein